MKINSTENKMSNSASGRVMAIDYGKKRTGIAVTDPLQLIASGLCTVETPKLVKFLTEYFSKENVSSVIIGVPVNWDDSDTDATPLVKHFIGTFKKYFSSTPIYEVDERFTSKMASDAMLAMGMKKKQRQNKAAVDEIAAAIMLQEYLERGKI